jgi:hypothetical protein
MDGTAVLLGGPCGAGATRLLTRAEPSRARLAGPHAPPGAAARVGGRFRQPVGAVAVLPFPEPLPDAVVVPPDEPPLPVPEEPPFVPDDEPPLPVPEEPLPDVPDDEPPVVVPAEPDEPPLDVPDPPLPLPLPPPLPEPLPLPEPGLFVGRGVEVPPDDAGGVALFVGEPAFGEPPFDVVAGALVRGPGAFVVFVLVAPAPDAPPPPERPEGRTAGLVRSASARADVGAPAARAVEVADPVAVVVACTDATLDATEAAGATTTAVAIDAAVSPAATGVAACPAIEASPIDASGSRLSHGRWSRKDSGPMPRSIRGRPMARKARTTTGSKCVPAQRASS